MDAHCKIFRFPLGSDRLPLNNDRSAVKGKTHCQKETCLNKVRLIFLTENCVYLKYQQIQICQKYLARMSI